MADKSELRRLGIAGRNDIRPKNRKRYDHAICRAVAGSAAFASAEVVMAYCGTDGEVDIAETAALARACGKTVVYPYCTAHAVMEALLPEDDAAWETDKNGMRAPAPGRSRRVDPSLIDLVLMPCTAFDAQGNRVGMGAGCYDRFLARCPHARTVLVAYEAQRVPCIEPDPTDVRADQIVTERISMAANP